MTRTGIDGPGADLPEDEAQRVDIRHAVGLETPAVYSVVQHFRGHVPERDFNLQLGILTNQGVRSGSRLANERAALGSRDERVYLGEM